MNNKVELLTTVIAGLKFHDAWKLTDARYVGTICKLEAEPDNKYDPWAIKVLASDGKMLGYIPKDRTQEIHPNWDRNPTAIVTLHQPQAIVIKVMVDEPEDVDGALDHFNQD